MTGFRHLIVARSSFQLLQGKEDLATYTFNTGIAQHYFCSNCGIKSYYIPRSHPHGVTVNARCIDSHTVESMKIVPFDGRNWEENIELLLEATDDAVSAAASQNCDNVPRCR
jgi:hypothetical protein